MSDGIGRAAVYKDVGAIKGKLQDVCNNCWHPYRLGGCPEHCGINEAVKAIDSIPPVDAVPVAHGYWRHYEGMLYCSECGTEFYDDIMEYCGDNVPHFCPHCGADMRKDGGDD